MYLSWQPSATIHVDVPRPPSSVVVVVQGSWQALTQENDVTATESRKQEDDSAMAYKASQTAEADCDAVGFASGVHARYPRFAATLGHLLGAAEALTEVIPCQLILSSSSSSGEIIKCDGNVSLTS